VSPAKQPTDLAASVRARLLNLSRGRGGREGTSRRARAAGCHPEARAGALQYARQGRSASVGYEINFNRYFYRYTPPRPLEVIESEIRGIEQDILRMLAEVTGGAP